MYQIRTSKTASNTVENSINIDSAVVSTVKFCTPDTMTGLIGY